MKRLATTPLVPTLILLSAFVTTTERGATLLAAQAAPPDAVAADPTRYSVMYENDIAQMIRVKYPAGARSVMHSHPAGCAIFYKDATLKTTSSTGEVRTHAYRQGDVSCGDGYSHTLENVGRETEFVQVHLKNRRTFDHVQTGRSLVYPARIKAPDPIDADPAHYFVQFENDVVRLARIKVPGGAKTPMHAHLAYCIVEIRDMETGVKAGDSSCGNAMAHESPNNAKSVNEAITIEFKNRDTFK
jgi:quercetin dioxygenase-like cupin family protein